MELSLLELFELMEEVFEKIELLVETESWNLQISANEGLILSVMEAPDKDPGIGPEIPDNDPGKELGKDPGKELT